MMEYKDPDVKVVLLDIEGTVCPISFVQDVLFPYALRALPPLLDSELNWPPPSPTSSSLAPFIHAFPPDQTTTRATFLTHITQLTHANSKAPALKALQGYLWTRGYQNGDLVCPLFPDVTPALHQWTATSTAPEPATATAATAAAAAAASSEAKTIIIYSSGSIAAQKLLFSHTTAGDLTPLIAHYFDTTTAGPKTLASSYEAIFQQSTPRDAAAAAGGIARAQCLFLSDNVREVRAALETGMRACVVVRDGNAPIAEGDRVGLRLVESFEEVVI